MHAKLAALTAAALGLTVPVVAAAYGDRTPVPPTDVQTVIAGTNGLSIPIPMDGTSCDPRAISENLKRLRAANVVVLTGLTETIPAQGHCYGACPSDLEAALKVHCEKADRLAAIVEAAEKK